jgi:hypothetical protein
MPGQGLVQRPGNGGSRARKEKWGEGGKSENRVCGRERRGQAAFGFDSVSSGGFLCKQETRGRKEGGTEQGNELLCTFQFGIPVSSKLLVI